jgi:hypothetical protein
MLTLALFFVDISMIQHDMQFDGEFGWLEHGFWGKIFKTPKNRADYCKYWLRNIYFTTWEDEKDYYYYFYINIIQLSQINSIKLKKKRNFSVWTFFI